MVGGRWSVAALAVVLTLSAGTARAGEEADRRSFVSAVRADVEWLAAKPTRVVGTRPHDEAVSELLDRIEAIQGAQVVVQEFPVVVPQIEKAELTVSDGGRKGVYRIYPVWPAGVRLNSTPEEGISGNLVYVGEGEYGKPPGKIPARTLRGHIAVMEMTAGHRWKSASSVGAMAVILLGSDDETTHHAHSHLVPIPIYVPRFYVPEGPLAAALRRGEISRGTIYAQARWTTVTATNIYAAVTPREPSEAGAIAIGIPMDSMSVVPELAPGADAAVDAAFGLNALRRFAANPPRRPVLFTFIDGYAFDQRGLREMLVTLAADPQGRIAEEIDTQDRERLEEYAAHKELAKGLGLDRESMSKLHWSENKSLRRYVKDEWAREVVRIEEKMHPRRLEKHGLLREKRELEEKLKAAGNGPHSEKARSDLDSLNGRLEDLVAVIDDLAERRAKRNSAQMYLLTRVEIPKDGERLELAREIWRRARHRIFTQLKELEETLKRRDHRLEIRSHVSEALGRGAGVDKDRPIAFLLGIDISDAGIAVGPSFRDSYLRVNTKGNAGSFCRWVEELERERGESLWPADLRHAVDLSTVTGMEPVDAHTVGNVAAFTGPAQSFALPAVTWATLDAPRVREDTAADVHGALDWERLEGQICATMVMSEMVANSDTERFDPTTRSRPHWCRAWGTIVDQCPGEPVPRLPMPGYLTTLVGQPRYSRPGSTYFFPVTGIRRQSFAFTGIDGRFVFDAVAGSRDGALGPHYVQSYDLSPDGRIVRAVNMQKAGRGVRLTVNVASVNPAGARAVVFSCGELSMVELFDPRFLVNLSSMKIIDAKRTCVPQRMNLSAYAGMVSCQLEPDTVWQMVLRASIAGNRMALLNMETPKKGTRIRDAMKGFRLGKPFPLHPLHIAARDFYRLDRRRLDDYTEAGITSEAIEKLQERTKIFLELADRAVEDDDGAALFSAASGAMANEVRVYQAVRDTANDVVRGAIFLLLMLVPFAYALERLFFSSAHIWKQIAGVIGIFTTMTLILWQYHPAFEISGQPMMVIMAFAVISMSLMVISVVYGKFKTSLEDLQSGRAEASGAKTSRAGLAGTAIRVGIANMRRRKFRTVLTSLTIVLITFAMLCFMSTSSYIGHREIGLGRTARFTGVLIRQSSSRAMPPAALTHLRRSVRGDRSIVARYWWSNQGNAGWRFHLRNRKNGASVSLTAALGVAPAEAELSGIDRACPSWEKFSEGDGCYLPEEAVTQLGVIPGDKVVMAGLELTYLGMLDASMFHEDIKRLDGELILPLDYSKLDADERSAKTSTGMEQLTAELESGTALAADEGVPYVSARSVAIVPASLLAEVPGSTLRSVSVRTETEDEARELAGELAKRLAFPVYYGSKKDVRVLASTPLLPKAPKSLIIPVIIAGMIIFNTMLSSIAERRREIYIYTSLGLAPLHVGFLFLAEAVTYALMGSIFGYIVGQGMATVFSALGWMGGLTLNYSGTQAISTMVMVLGVVVLSSLVPAFLAGKVAVPSNEMRWRVPKPVDGVIRDKLPFTVTGKTAGGVMAFLYDYLDAHREGSIGTFSTDDLSTFRSSIGGRELSGIEGTVWLEPYDLGVRQDIRVYLADAGEEDVYNMHLELRRRSGQESSWWKLNRVLLGDLRRQLLGWRNLKLEHMLEYIAREGLSPEGIPL